MFLQYIVNRKTNLKIRLQLLSMFTYMPNRPVKGVGAKPEDGTIVFREAGMTLDTAKYGYYEDGKFVTITVAKHNKGAPFSLHDYIQLSSGYITTYKESAPIKTTIGRFIINHLLIADVVGDRMPYMNNDWDIGYVEGLYATAILAGEVSTSQYRKYLDNGYFIGHFGELVVPGITEKAITTDPQIAIRKKELLAQYSGKELDAKTIVKIEDELIAMDKAWVKGDPAEGIFGANPGKSYGVHRKKMFIMVGGVSDFSKEGGSAIIEHSLSEGWDKEAFPALANEIRQGSYSRGKETEKGGTITKVMFRAFQDVTISEDDCGTNTGIPVTFSKNININKFIGRTILVGGKQILLTEENVGKYSAVSALLRSPMSCKTKNGQCYTCSGLNFKQLGLTSPGVQSIQIGSKFMNASMKMMHGTKLTTIVVDPTKFFVQ